MTPPSDQPEQIGEIFGEELLDVGGAVESLLEHGEGREERDGEGAVGVGQRDHREVAARPQVEHVRLEGELEIDPLFCWRNDVSVDYRL